MSVQRAIRARPPGQAWRRGLPRALLLGVLLLCGAVQGARAQFTRFQNVTDEEGLGNLVVTALAQDGDGYILVGTEGGLYRYDGFGVTAYDSGLPPASLVQQIVVDGGGVVWVVTGSGLYVREGAAFARVEIGGDAVRLRSPHLLARSGRDVVLDVEGALLRATVGDGGVGAFSPLAGAADGPAGPGKARFVAADAGGAVVAGCGVALCRVEGGRVAVIGEAEGLPADEWQVALGTADGTLWARSLDRIAWRRPGRAVFSVAQVPVDSGAAGGAARGQHTSYTAAPAMLDLVDDGHGGVLTQGPTGLVDWDGTRWRSYAHHQGGLPPDRLQGLMLDREGSLWAGSVGAGAYRSIGRDEWEHWTSADGLPSSVVWSMARLGGQVWVATDNGTATTDGAPAGVAAETNYIVKATRGGRLWMAPVGQPLARRDPSGGIEQVASPGKVVSAHLDRGDGLWLATPEGLFLVRDADGAPASLRAEPMFAHATTLVTTDDAGLVWALSPEGVFRRDADGRFGLVVSPALLGSAPVAMAFSPEGDLWVGTASDGVARFRMADGHATPLPSLAIPVLGSNNVLSARRDRRGWMWLGTDHGIDLFDGQGWRHMDSSGGPISNDLDEAAITEDVDGSMWFGTSHGLSHLVDPGRLPPEAALHALVTGVSLGARALPLPDAGDVGWSREPLVVRFADLDYTRGRKITFRYRMAGLDAGWGTTTEHEVRYASLPAGDLRFELVAVDSVHGGTSARTGFAIRIRAPWWRRWWFYGLCGFAGAGTLAAAWQARMRILLHGQRRLEQVVRARTAEIEQARSELQHQAGELERQADDMQRLAMSDALTGLANRRAIMAALEAAIGGAPGTPLAVLLYDVDHFKRINDNFGHGVGDEVLVEFARRLSGAARPPEAVGRYGGEEFLVLLPGGPELLAGRVAAIGAALVDTPFVFGGSDRRVTASGGLAFLRAGDTSVSLLERADAALYRAKENGRDRIEEERSEASERRREAEAGVALACVAATEDERGRLARDLGAALVGGQFALHYQPVVDVERGLVTSHEALLRWDSPTRGRVAPVDFVPFAEECGMIAEIGDWVLRAACLEAAGWAGGTKVSVNLSPVQLRLPDLVDRVAQALAAAGLAPGRLELEVTETAAIEDLDTAAAVLGTLRDMGVTIALDDFGTGYSSLSLLRALPFSRIKIDRCFVQDLDVRPGALAIVGALVEMCRGLGVAATAEGVETKRQVELLRGLGCTELQGYRIGRPCPASEIVAWVANPEDAGMEWLRVAHG